MSKITSKLQVTVPKAIADQYGIRPGDEVEWVPAGESIRVVQAHRVRCPRSVAERLRLFDQATERHQERQVTAAPQHGDKESRGWTREELYDRGRSD
jgi:AbrB family looped-hinge helix DNA binding protein